MLRFLVKRIEKTERKCNNKIENIEVELRNKLLLLAGNTDRLPKVEDISNGKAIWTGVVIGAVIGFFIPIPGGMIIGALVGAMIAGESE